MSVNFAASASLVICIGPTAESCIFVPKQKCAAGFDAIGGPNVDTSLTAFYTNVLEYAEKPPSCDGDLSMDAEYWHCPEEPHVTVSITDSTCCMESADFINKRKGRLL
jgi:hypothetical protein